MTGFRSAVRGVFGTAQQWSRSQDFSHERLSCPGRALVGVGSLVAVSVRGDVQNGLPDSVKRRRGGNLHPLLLSVFLTLD